MNVWGLVVAATGVGCVYIGYKGTQGKVWQMITGNTLLSSSSESKQFGNLPSGALPLHTVPPGTKAVA
jgi:hypothetical protein